MCEFDLCKTCSEQPRNYSRGNPFRTESSDNDDLEEQVSDVPVSITTHVAAAPRAVAYVPPVAATHRADSDVPPPSAAIRRQRLKLAKPASATAVPPTEKVQDEEWNNAPEDDWVDLNPAHNHEWLAQPSTMFMKQFAKEAALSFCVVTLFCKMRIKDSDLTWLVGESTLGCHSF
jgi:hypothetical protein